jgi:N-acetylglucosamine-6-phosphate deacetylase
MDLQLNGAFGLDFTAQPEAIWEVAAGLPRYGVTAFLPTIITSPLETVVQAQAVLRRGPPPGWRGARPIGLHLEGPFLNPGKRGAHNAAQLRPPDSSLVRDWSPETGIRLVTLAPELPGALEVARCLHERGVVVSAGHSLATYEEALAGLEAGLSYGTHLFNAMPTLEHRAPGLAGAWLVEPRVVVGVIPDGIHLHPGLIKLIWQNKGPDHVNIVTDAMAALGMPPGRYHLGELDVIVDEASARLSDGRLAGSVVSLEAALRRFTAFTGCTAAQAVATVTTTPARLLRLADQGQLTPGAIADLVLLTSELEVKATIIGGEIAWQA